MMRRICYPDAEANDRGLFTGERLAKLEALGDFVVHCGRPESDDGFLERIGDAHAVLSGWGLSNDVLRRAPNLEVVSFTGFGVGTFVDLEESARLGITVTRTLSTADTLAEHTLALMLAAARHIARLDRDTRAGGWNQGLAGMDLRGKTLGLVGLGRIAERVVPLAQAFGMRVIAWTRTPDDERAARFGIEFMALDELIGASDVLSLHLPVTPETRGLINASRLAQMKSGAVFVNTARAELLDEQALAEALRSGHIVAAGLDVYSQEPLPPAHPLLDLENVVLTPHCGYNTPEATVAIMDMAIDNLVAFYAGRPTNVANAN